MTRWARGGAAVSVVALSGVVSVGRSATEVSKRVELVVSPSTVLIDQSVDVRGIGLRPHRSVTLEVTTRDRVGVSWRSRTQMNADDNGRIDTRGTMKPFWSMRPLGRPAATTRFALTRGPMKTNIRVLSLGKLLARGVVSRSTEATALMSTDATLSGQGFVGTYYSLPSQQPQPALVTLDGSGGGHGELPAALIASHGFPTLSLAFFGENGLPPTLKDIPLEYFAKALRWLGSQPGVDAQRIAVLGISRGGEAALLLGATYPDLVRGVIACTPSSEVLAGSPGGNAWTVDGKPIPLGPIPVEAVAAKTWVTGGGKDEIIDSAQGVRDILVRAQSHQRRNIQGAIYAQAGHAIGCVIPNQPLPQEFSLPSGGFFERGGTPAANEAAAAASWPHIEQLLRSLGR